MSGIAEIGDLGHVMESLLEAVAEGRLELGQPGLMLLERGFDRLHGMSSRITARQAIAMPSNLIDSFERAATGDYGVAEAPIDAASAEKSASAQQSKAAPAPDRKSTRLNSSH